MWYCNHTPTHSCTAPTTPSQLRGGSCRVWMMKMETVKREKEDFVRLGVICGSYYPKRVSHRSVNRLPLEILLIAPKSQLELISLYLSPVYYSSRMQLKSVNIINSIVHRCVVLCCVSNCYIQYRGGLHHSQCSPVWRRTPHHCTNR